MDINLQEIFTYLDTLLSQKINNEDLLTGSESKFFYITSEEIETYLKSFNNNKQACGFKNFLPSLDILAKIFGLSEVEKQILLIILAPEIDPKYERIYAYLQDDLTRKYPTISLILHLLSKNQKERMEIFSYFLPYAPLLKYKLIHIENNSGCTLISCPLRLEASIRNFILGYYNLDDRLEHFCKINFYTPERKISSKVQKILKIISLGIKKKKTFLFHIHGPPGSGRKNFALEVARGLGYNLLEVNTSFILSLYSLNEIENILKVIFREALLSGSLVYFDQFEAFFEHEKNFLYEPIFLNVLKDFSWFTFCAGEKVWQPQRLSNQYLFLKLSFYYPDYLESCKLWENHLKEISSTLAKTTGQKLARLFKFTQGEIKEVAQQLKIAKLAGCKIDKKTVYDVCRERVCKKISHLAQHLKLLYTWEDIVLPQEQLNQLKEIPFYYQHQYQVFEKWGFKKRFVSQGTCILFTGSPGTGKTMAAGIIAHELGLDLYRIELSRIISKYIGETEKNLAQIFNAAEGAGVILFFDEADALFGKRTEVKDAHDRYANIEVGYLLQKIEEFDGLVILASNFRRNIDEAFIRRMHFIIEFPFPDEKMREEIWKKVFPPEAPLEKDIDFSYLAKNFKLSGGNIRNAALASAFYAAEDRRKITMEHILKGIKSELQKMGKTFKL